MLVLLAAILSGCTPDVRVINEVRYLDTSLGKGESIGLLLVRYGECFRSYALPAQGGVDDRCGPDEDLNARQKEFEECLSRAIRIENPDVHVVSSEEISAVLAQYAGRIKPYSHADPKAGLEARLENPALRDTLATLGAKYLVAISVETTESIGAVEEGALIWSRSFNTITLFRGTIYESASGDRAGFLNASLSGDSGVGVVYYVVPLPVAWSTDTNTEPRICAAMGGALAQFITKAENR